MRAFEGDKEVGKIDTAQGQPDRRHDDIFHKRIDDPRERRADDHADRQVDDVAAQNELLKAAKLLAGTVPDGRREGRVGIV